MFNFSPATNSMNRDLFYPMAAYVFYMVAFGVYNFYTRYKAIKTGQVDFKYFKAMQGEAPHHVVNVGRHYDNQFQLPILFLVTCLAHMQLGKTNQTTLVLAWLFCVTRLVHTYFHVVNNRVPKRAAAFMMGWLVIAALWIQLLILLP
jgi:hypothetical protein